jgi:hypothetical protein
VKPKQLASRRDLVSSAVEATADRYLMRGGIWAIERMVEDISYIQGCGFFRESGAFEATDSGIREMIQVI